MSSLRAARASSLASLASLALPALLAALLTACAGPQGTAVLLPSPNGRATAVVFTQGQQQAVLDQPYAGARTGWLGPRPFVSSEADVRQRFGAALDALPLPPAQFTLYFEDGKDEFTEESRPQIDGIFAEIARRPVPDVLVIGHTDRVGSDAYNDALSRQRAEVVRLALMVRGIAPDNVVAIGRGKREPVVMTADGVAEPRNRRVEIQVR
jgi:outer membrane protein OmpA-like peptidoglycan-associated protein